MSYNRELIFSFKQRSNELLIHVWEMFRGLAYVLDHGLGDWMLMHSFYCGLTMSSKSYVNGQSEKTFMELTVSSTYILLDGLLLENKLKLVWRNQVHLKNHLMISMSFIIFMKKRNK
jgi:hypothetical protein